jgi:tetratricopeptide (TPR) repeat protein
VTWYLLAGAAAQSATADAEAIRYLDRGLDLLPQLPAAPERDVLEFNLHLVRGNSHVSTQGYSAPGAVADFRRSLELSEEVATGIDAIPPTAAIWAYYLVHGDLRSAHEAMERLRAMTRPDFDAEILCCSGVQLFFEGAFGESLATLQNAVDVFDGRGPDARPPGGWLIPNDSRSVALTHLGLVLALVGETRAADARLEQAMAAAQSLPNYPTGAFTEAYVASYSGLVASLSQRYEDARACHEHALALGERYGMQFWLSTATAGCAIASGYLGDPRTSIEVLTPALEQWQSLGAGALVPFDLTHRGYLHLAVGDVDAALADVDAALALAEATTEQFFTAETHRVRASILLAAHPDDLPAVRAALATASDVAAHQGAWLFELRAALDVLELPGTRAAADVDHLRDLLARAPAGAAVPELARARAVVTG